MSNVYRVASSIIRLAGGGGVWRPPSSPLTFDYYIGPSGSDSNAGTLGSPWAITALNSKASTIAGRRVGLLDGTYRLPYTSGNTVQNVPATASGTSGAHTIIQAVNSRQAIITTDNGSGVFPQGVSSGGGALDTIHVDAAFVDFLDLVIGPTGGHGISIENGHDILIQGCWLKDMLGTRDGSYTDDNLGGIFTRTQSIAKQNVIVRDCLVEDIYALHHDIQTSGPNDSCGIGSMFGAENWLIEYCTFRRMGKPAFYKGQVKNVTFRYNFTIDCSGLVQAFTTANTGNSSTNYMYGNIAKVNWCFGAASSNTQGDACNTAEFYNNTIIMDTIEGINVCDFGYIVWMGGANPQSLRFYNNAVYLNPAFGLGPGMHRFPTSTQNPSARISLWDYNLYSKLNVEDNVNGLSYTGLAGSPSWQGAGHDTHSPAVGALGLVNQSGTTVNDFRPDIGSALLLAGKSGGVSGGTTIDIGFTGLGITPGTTW